MKIIIKAIATVFGIGYFPVAPGTVASAFCLALFWFCPEMTTVFWICLIVFLFLIGVWTSTKAEQFWGHDPSRVVADEFVGQLIVIVPFEKTAGFIIGAFVLFRLFDITKVAPVSYGEKLPGGWGIMMDDVIAGILAAVVLAGARLFLT
ncbi:phosphatidylglycerophosphatase A [candidate division KSB1 bacterium]|nr:phosphatidylglycerophosphatase A [candidate division KSB1 bacterium]